MRSPELGDADNPQGRDGFRADAPDMEVHLLLAADYPFLDILWTMSIFFICVAWIWVLIMALADNFSRRDHSGWAKALWTIFIIFVPLLGVLLYIITRPAPEETAVARQ